MRRLIISLWALSGGFCLQAQTLAQSLPDAPEPQIFQEADFAQMLASSGVMARMPLCTPANTPPAKGKLTPEEKAAAKAAAQAGKTCIPLFDPYTPFVDGQMITPMTVRQKGLLAVHDIVNPVNLMTIAFTSAFGVAIDSHSAYGPGMRGWGRDMGYSLLQDSQGEVISTFMIASLTHEDPRYHRMPNGTTKARLWHALTHTYVSRHDDGRKMPNYETLIGFPASAELSNLYVPGVAGNLKSTAERVAIGWAANPADDLITEFLPDFARHFHVRVVFVRQVLNRVAAGQNGGF